MVYLNRRAGTNCRRGDATHSAHACSYCGVLRQQLLERPVEASRADRQARVRRRNPERVRHCGTGALSPRRVLFRTAHYFQGRALPDTACGADPAVDRDPAQVQLGGTAYVQHLGTQIDRVHFANGRRR